MKRTAVRATDAAAILSENLGKLQHPDAGMLRLVQFSHQSEGVKTLAGQIGEALVKLLEDRGWVLCNGQNDAAAWLTAQGWMVAPPEGSGENLGEGSRGNFVDDAPLFELSPAEVAQ